MGPRKRKEKGTENISEDVRVENFPNLGKETDRAGEQILQVQKICHGKLW